MSQQGMQSLVGRAMLDPDFLAELLRAPEVAMAEFDLDESERVVLRQAAAHLAATPPAERARAFQSAIVRRLAT
jgi:hypothetical protein